MMVYLAYPDIVLHKILYKLKNKGFEFRDKALLKANDNY